MYVSVVVCLCLYAYRFRDTLLVVKNLVNKDSELDYVCVDSYLFKWL